MLLLCLSCLSMDVAFQYPPSFLIRIWSDLARTHARSEALNGFGVGRWEDIRGVVVSIFNPWWYSITGVLFMVVLLPRWTCIAGHVSGWVSPFLVFPFFCLVQCAVADGQNMFRRFWPHVPCPLSTFALFFPSLSLSVVCSPSHFVTKRNG
jgi:hypothetical protein